MASVSTIKTEDGKISCETPEGTVININITQRSALDCLLDTTQANRKRKDRKRSGMDVKLTGGSNTALRTGLGASMISMGAVCFMLAVIFCVVKPYLFMMYRGTLFWVGIPFIVSGVLNIVACRRPNAFLEILTFITLLLSLSVSIAGLAMAVDDFHRLSWGSSGCQQYQAMLSALVIMIELLLGWGMSLAIFGLSCRLKALYSTCVCERLTEEEDEPLLPPNPSGEIFIA